MDEFASQFWAAGRRLGLTPPRFPYMLRCAGASRDFVDQFRPLREVKRRGRWQSQAFHTYLWEANEDAKGVGTAWRRALWMVGRCGYINHQSL